MNACVMPATRRTSSSSRYAEAPRRPGRALNGSRSRARTFWTTTVAGSRPQRAAHWHHWRAAGMDGGVRVAGLVRREAPPDAGKRRGVTQLASGRCRRPAAARSPGVRLLLGRVAIAHHRAEPRAAGMAQGLRTDLQDPLTAY